MSVTRKLMNNLAGQFGAGAPAQAQTMGPWAKALMVASLTISTAVAVPEAQAQQQREIMPERSAVHWGGQLGTIFGAAAGNALGERVSDPGVRRVIVGASTEAGRNAGGIAAGTVHQGQRQQAGANRMSQETVDHLDRLGLSAAFAYDDWMRVQSQMERGMASQTQLNQARNRFFQARDSFAGSVRSARLQGHQVHIWTQMSEALHQRVVNEAEVTRLARGMADRLNRPGGPGFRDPNVAQDRTSLSDLRERMAQQRYHDDRHHAPVMR